MDYGFTFFAIAIPAVLFAGISKGGFGSAAAFAAAPLLALILEPAQAVAIMLPLLIVMDFTAVRHYWRKWDPPTANVLILGGLPGAVLGAVLVSVADPDLFRLLIGLIAVGFVIWQLAKAWRWVRTPKRPFSDKAGIVFGIGAGFTSFIAHAGGPVTSIYMLTKGLTKTEYQATTVVVFWVTNLVKLVLYVGLGFIGWSTLKADLYLFPFAIIGTYMGVWLNGIVPERIYFAFIYVCLILAGTKLIYDSLS